MKNMYYWLIRITEICTSIVVGLQLSSSIVYFIYLSHKLYSDCWTRIHDRMTGIIININLKQTEHLQVLKLIIIDRVCLCVALGDKYNIMPMARLLLNRVA